MIVHVDDEGARVRDADDLGNLSLEVKPGVDLAAQLGSLGTVDDDGEHVWLAIDALRIAAAATLGDRDNAAWNGRYESMVSYARSHGFADASGDHLRAHIVRPH